MAFSFPWMMFGISAVAVLLINGIQKMIIRFEENPGRGSDNFKMALQDASMKLKTHEFACWIFMVAGFLWGVQDTLLS